MPAFINHSVFSFGVGNAPSVYMPALLIFPCILILIVHSLGLLFTCHCSVSLCVCPTLNDSCGLWGEGHELLLNKGNAAKMGMIWNTIHVILYVPQAEQIMRFLFYPFFFLNVYDVMYVCVCVCVCVNLHSCENLFCWSHVCVRLCYQKDYSESTYPVTQRLRRTPSERNSRSLVCTLYDSSCLFCFSTFYVKCYLFFFLSLSLPL